MGYQWNWICRGSLLLSNGQTSQQQHWVLGVPQLAVPQPLLHVKQAAELHPFGAQEVVFVLLFPMVRRKVPSTSSLLNEWMSNWLVPLAHMEMYHLCILLFNFLWNVSVWMICTSSPHSLFVDGLLTHKRQKNSQVSLPWVGVHAGPPAKPAWWEPLVGAKRRAPRVPVLSLLGPAGGAVLKSAFFSSQW